MKQAVQNSYMHATRLVDELVKQGTPFREAHEIIGNLVGYCIENQRYFHELSTSEWEKLVPGLEAAHRP
jgi:argininosuccinate lyase